MEVPERFRPAAYADAATFHPAFFYEALWSLATVGVLLLLERRGVLRRGQLFLGYLVAYGFGRFALELLRTDTTFRLLGISRNGWVAVALALGGVAGLVHLRRRADRDPDQPASPTASSPSEPVLLTNDREP